MTRQFSVAFRQNMVQRLTGKHAVSAGEQLQAYLDRSGFSSFSSSAGAWPCRKTDATVAQLQNGSENSSGNLLAKRRLRSKRSRCWF
jgi:hypothetical protein